METQSLVHILQALPETSWLVLWGVILLGLGTGVRRAGARSKRLRATPPRTVTVARPIGTLVPSHQSPDRS